MKLSTLLLINAIAAFINALGFIFAPAQLLAFHLGVLGSTGEWIARELGGSTIGYAVLCWLARDVRDAAARRAIVIALGVSWGVGFVIALFRQFAEVANQNGWSAVAIYFLFAAGYAYFFFKGKME
ncbi:MAG: hypothetical protein HY070_06605 [Chloroflexi bacterium]|nr:hypothetical protein [Chloroflexota bacterium]MBI3741762.1 hypothetical protein [Chloroflexota bacterium]